MALMLSTVLHISLGLASPLWRVNKGGMDQGACCGPSPCGCIQDTLDSRSGWLSGVHLL